MIRTLMNPLSIWLALTAVPLATVNREPLWVSLPRVLGCCCSARATDGSRASTTAAPLFRRRNVGLGPTVCAGAAFGGGVSLLLGSGALEVATSDTTGTAGGERARSVWR